MNIIVNPYGNGHCYCRPDTTWEKENKDFYAPDCVSELYWTPVVFARISKAGKCVSRKFAPRYYDAYNYGILFYCKVDGHDEFITCVDHTSILPSPSLQPELMETSEGEYKVMLNSNEAFASAGVTAEVIEEAICKASALTSVRIGDYIVVELAKQTMIPCKENNEVEIKGSYNNSEIFSKKVIF